MGSTITALVIVVALSAWHLWNRRHPGWPASSDGRFGIFCGYALVAIAAYWLESDPTVTAWEWALDNVWALAAMIALSGFDRAQPDDGPARGTRAAPGVGRAFDRRDSPAGLTLRLRL